MKTEKDIDKITNTIKIPQSVRLYCSCSTITVLIVKAVKGSVSESVSVPENAIASFYFSVIAVSFELGPPALDTTCVTYRVVTFQTYFPLFIILICNGFALDSSLDLRLLYISWNVYRVIHLKEC